MGHFWRANQVDATWQGVGVGEGIVVANGGAAFGVRVGGG